MSKTIMRITIPNRCITEARNDVYIALKRKMKKKGKKAFISRHEIFGIIYEELDELKDAMRNNDDVNFEEELIDIALSSIFCLASFRATRIS